MIKMPLSVVHVAVFCLPLALVASCGGSGEPEGVQATVIDFDPDNIATITLDIESIDSLGAAQIFRVEARSPTGYPQIGVDLYLSSGFTVYAGRPPVTCVETQAYDGTVSPRIGTITTCSAPGATPLDLTKPVKTGPNGTYELTVVYSVSPFVTGDITVIEAFSGTGYNSANAVVECGDAVDPGDYECL